MAISVALLIEKQPKVFNKTCKKMRTTEESQNKIKGYEGFRMYAYQDGNGIWTCGYGHTKDVNRETRFSKQTAERKFLEDLGEVEAHLNVYERNVGGLTAGQYDALASFVFNVGWTKFVNSTLCKIVASDKNSPAVGEEFRKWIYCNKKPLAGLVKRRNWERRRYYEK